MQLPRMTTRRWMVAVALFGVTMSVVVAIRAGWNYFLALRRIQYHTGMEATWRWLDPLGRDEKQAIDQALGIIDEQRQITGDFSLDEDFKSAMVEYLRILTPPHHKQEYHAAMARKYRHVARLPLAPDRPRSARARAITRTWPYNRETVTMTTPGDEQLTTGSDGGPARCLFCNVIVDLTEGSESPRWPAFDGETVCDACSERLEKEAPADAAVIERCLSILTSLEREVVMLHYGICDSKRFWRLDEIAERLGIKPERVAEIEKHSLEKTSAIRPETWPLQTTMSASIV